MKKSIIVGMIIFLCIIVLAIVAGVLVTDISVSKENSDTISDIYNMYVNDVDSAVQHLMSSKRYNKMSKNDQIKKMGILLELYEEKGEIKGLYYDKDGPSYTFTYNYGDIKGALRSVLLKDWNPMMN